MLTKKGSPEHKFGGLIYLPLSATALILGSWMAWREQSMVLFSFNCFCAYLLLSGWRAVRESQAPKLIDIVIPAGLFAIALAVTFHAVWHDQGLRSFYELFFAMNAFYLSWRDWKHLKSRIQLNKYKIFLPGLTAKDFQSASWMGRHIAGMIGSVIANLSVVVLTLLPLSLHWLWPVTLLTIGFYIWFKEQQKKARIRQSMATILQPKFRTPYAKTNDDVRRAA